MADIDTADVKGDVDDAGVDAVDEDADEEADEDENVVAGIDFSLDNLSRPEQIGKGRKIIEQVKELPDYPGRDTMVAEVTKSIDEFERAVRAEEFAAYELQVASREAREAERKYFELAKKQPRH